MPIYEYVCNACGKPFDYLARTFSDAPKSCPNCGGKKLTKAFSSFQAETKSDAGCVHADSCSHAHGHGCGCGCCH
ncbi:MAG: zinc ribbon domain-containing protein [Kiritimatiellia bacterium]